MLSLDDHLCFALYAAHRAMTSAYGPLLDPLGLTHPQYLTLLAIDESPEACVKSVGERLRLDSGTLTPLLQRLERAGLVSRARDGRDGRRVHVQLTPAGRERLDQARDAVRALLCQRQLDLTAAEPLRGALWALVEEIDRASPL